MTARTKLELNLQVRDQAVDRWANRLLAPGMPGQKTLSAIQPSLAQWATRKGYRLTFRLVQVLTNHGVCFGKYLHRNNREPTEFCHQ